ncbi:hypothetical protein ACIBJC_36070 [Streptomyces sp. NPDC050509]|uniref:hypothetical protein n=1 Tax=Streptomyces sp. NPDC050509 TaxID=3365620 RepID=UPI0037B30B1E
MSDARALGHRDDVTAFRGKADEGREDHVMCSLTWAVDARGESYHVSADGPWGTAEGHGHDLVAALDTVRRTLEREGWLLAINAARPDVAQSGMLRGSGSDRAYVLRPGTPARPEDMVSLFDDAPPSAVSTADAQKEAYERWLGSFGVPGLN